MVNSTRNPNGVRHLAEVNEAKAAKLYKAEYIGSGTFIISKPKRKKAKMRQTRLKNLKRGSRK
jgi:preprotein translocase subunit YajC